MKNLITLKFILLLNLLISTAVFSQKEIEKIDSVYFEVVKTSKRGVTVKITNNKRSQIYVMNKKYTGQRAYKYVTNCDSLNSDAFRKPINIPPDYYSKKTMARIKSGTSKRVKFRFLSDYFGINKCDYSKDAFAYLKVFIYVINEEQDRKTIGYIETIGYVMSEEKIKIEGYHSRNKEKFIELDLFDSTAVKNYLSKNDICEQLNFVQLNPEYFIEENDSYSHLILNNISKETKRSISILAFNHHEQEVSDENKTNYLIKQIRLIHLEYCKKSDE